MGQGTDAARAAGSDVHADAMDNMKDQLIIVLINRLRGNSRHIDIPVAEIDGTGAYLLYMQLVSEKSAPSLRFSVEKKN